MKLRIHWWRLVILTAAMVIVGGGGRHAGFAQSNPHGLYIATDRTSYSPTMSSVVGTRLTPSRKARPGERLRWRTRFGRFVRWQGPAFKVQPLGQQVMDDGRPIYWTFDLRPRGAKRAYGSFILESLDRKGRVRESDTKPFQVDDNTAHFMMN